MFKLQLKNLVLPTILLMGIMGNLAAQGKEEFLPPFDYEIVSFPGESAQLSRTHVFVWIRTSHLQFITRDTAYAATYQLNLGIYKKDGSSVLTADKSFQVAEQSYATTIDPKVQRAHHFEFQLPSNDYRFELRLIDLNSKRIRVQDRKKEVRSFDFNHLGLSDVLIVTTEQFDSIKAEEVIPSFRIPIQEKIFVYAQIIKSANTQQVKIESSLKQQNGQEGFTFSKDIIPKKEVTSIFLQINKDSMLRGPNELYLKVSDGANSKAVRKDLVFITGLEKYVGQSIDDLIAPLTYVTDGDEWKKLVNAPAEERDRVFQEFWNRRDPTPASPENELFDEFYKRVDFTNKNFGVSKQIGWRTDRGRVFIVFGPPDRIETATPSRYTSGSYEIWYYEDLREKFVFLDEYGFGDFRLVSGNVRPTY